MNGIPTRLQALVDELQDMRREMREANIDAPDSMLQAVAHLKNAVEEAKCLSHWRGSLAKASPAHSLKTE